MEALHNPRYNFAAILLAVALALGAVYFGTELRGPNGMAILVVQFIPVLTGAVTVGLYMLLRWLLPRGAWVATVLGIITLLMLAISVL